MTFFYDLYRLSFESSKGTIEIVGSDRPLIIKDVDFILTELEMFVTKATLKNTDFSYSTGKIGIQGDIVDSFFINFKGIFSLSGNIKNTLLDHFSGTLRVNGNIDTCYFRHMNFKKIIINGKISASSFSGTDFRNTHFYKEINLNDIAESKKNIFSGKFYFSQEDKSFLYFLNSKFSTLSFTQFLNYPGMEKHYQSCYLLRGTDLREVNFQDFELQQVLKKYFLLDLSGANLEGVKFDYFSQDVSNTHYINLLDANLKDASFRYANLQHFDFTESDLSNCDFSLTNLVSANVGDTKIKNIKLRIDQLFQFYDQDHIDFSSLRLVGSLESQWQDQSLEGAKLSSQAFQYLIQQGFRNFSLTDLSRISNDILLQYYSRIDLDFEFARLPTDFGFNRCLENKHRKRRELCLFGWDEVDQFNEEKMDSRNLNKILIRSESFLTTFMSASMAQQEQLLEFAKHYPIIGSETHKIQHLLQFSRWQSNLNKLNHVSLLALKGLMTKDLAVSILNGAYDDTAINLGLLSAGKLLSEFSNEIKVYEKALQLNGKKLLSKVFKISAPFTAHATIAYLVYDLIQAVKQLDKENANNFLLRIIDDGIYLSIDATEIAIKMTELFEIAEISFLIEPVTLVLELVVFLGSDIYQAVEFVQQINNIVDR